VRGYEIVSECQNAQDKGKDRRPFAKYVGNQHYQQDVRYGEIAKGEYGQKPVQKCSQPYLKKDSHRISYPPGPGRPAYTSSWNSLVWQLASPPGSHGSDPPESLFADDGFRCRPIEFYKLNSGRSNGNLLLVCLRLFGSAGSLRYCRQHSTSRERHSPQWPPRPTQPLLL
jgi:hypothetical protein